MFLVNLPLYFYVREGLPFKMQRGEGWGLWDDPGMPSSRMRLLSSLKKREREEESARMCMSERERGGGRGREGGRRNRAEREKEEKEGGRRGRSKGGSGHNKCKREKGIGAHRSQIMSIGVDCVLHYRSCFGC